MPESMPAHICFNVCVFMHVHVHERACTYLGVVVHAYIFAETQLYAAYVQFKHSHFFWALGIYFYVCKCIVMSMR